MILRSIFSLFLTTNVVFIITFNKNMFFTAEAFIIVIPFFFNII